MGSGDIKIAYLKCAIVGGFGYGFSYFSVFIGEL